MANTTINKVVLGNETLIDLTSDTVTAGKMTKGTTAHDKSGNQITGTLDYKYVVSSGLLFLDKASVNSTKLSVSGSSVSGTKFVLP